MVGVDVKFTDGLKLDSYQMSETTRQKYKNRESGRKQARKLEVYTVFRWNIIRPQMARLVRCLYYPLGK